MTNIDSTTIDFVSIPALSEDNYAAVAEEFRERPIPAELVESVSARLQRIEVQSVRRADGTPTWYFADLTTGRMFIDSVLACSVTNCTGHDLAETDSWIALSHTVAETTLERISGLEESDTDLELALTSQGPVLVFYSKLVGSLPFDQAPALAANLEEIASELRKFHAANRVVGTPSV